MSGVPASQRVSAWRPHMVDEMGDSSLSLAKDTDPNLKGSALTTQHLPKHHLQHHRAADMGESVKPQPALSWQHWLNTDRESKASYLLR